MPPTGFTWEINSRGQACPGTVSAQKEWMRVGGRGQIHSIFFLKGGPGKAGRWYGRVGEVILHSGTFPVAIVAICRRQHGEV